MRYGHIVSAFYARPWAILPETLAIMQELLAFRVQGGRLSADEIQARLEAVGPRQRETAQARPGIAVIPLYGMIAPRASTLAETSTGGTGLDTFMGAFRSAMADPEVGSILIDIDSPGGQVGGLTEAAAEIRAARDQKPITAFANVAIGAASAAYWLGAQASEIVASPSSQVGSIGIRGTHEDMSAFYEQKGIKHTMIAAGKYKTEGSPYGPLSEETLAHAQSEVDAYYEMFLADVAKGRQVAVSLVRSDFGEGRMLLAKDALKAGMIDRIDTLGGAIARIAKTMPRQTAAALVGPGWTALDLEPATINGTTTITTTISAEVTDPEAPVVEPADAAGFAFELELRRRRAAARA
jgi:signal peptide peptidase SppA